MSQQSVAGDHFFFSTQDPVRFTYASVDTFVLIFGLSLNSLLLYLISTKTVAIIAPYKKLLMMSCMMDLIVAFWTFIAQPMPSGDHGYRTVLMNGVFRGASQPIRYAVYLIWIQLMHFFLVTTMSQYVYRYCILCRDGVMSATIFWSLIFAQLFLNGSHAILLAWADYPRAEEAAQQMALKQLMSDESGISDIQFVSFVNTQEFRWILHLAVMICLTIIFYIVITICFFRIRKVVQAMSLLKHREYNKQVSAALLFQSLLPTFEIAAWCIQIFLPMFMADQSTVMYIVFSDIAIHLVPVLNPIGTILLVAPYRRALSSSLMSIINKGGRITHLRSVFTASNHNNRIDDMANGNGVFRIPLE